MKNLINKLIRLLCVSVIGVLGFSSCEEHSDEYGTPITTFRYWGTVTDEAGNPIEGINVIMSGNILGMPNVKLKTESYMYGEDMSVFLTGRFSTANTQITTIDFVDVDGEENGGDFQSVTITPQDMVEEPRYDDMPPRGTLKEYKATIKLKKK
jgi:putative lipoprotein (rSAM/lipoprotein system)